MKKIHRLWRSDDSVKTWCGLPRSSQAEATDTWRDVTCRNCLKQRPRRR